LSCASAPAPTNVNAAAPKTARRVSVSIELLPGF
jgi:hypothetical protein